MVEDIANLELRPTFLGIVDDSALGEDVIHKLKNHKVNTEYMQTIPNGMGTWLAVFDHNGDVAGSISQRPNLLPIMDTLEEKGDEIFAEADSVVIEFFYQFFQREDLIVGRRTPSQKCHEVYDQRDQ